MLINAKTKLCATLANPNRTTSAPVMYNAAFNHLGLPYVYVALEPAQIGPALKGVKALGIHGVSISTPFKVKAVNHVDAVDDVAREIGAINLAVNDNGTLTGYNTDWIGAVRALEEVRPLSGASVLLLGAGGAAQAVGYGLVRAGANIIVHNRSAKNGRKLADDLHVGFGGDLAMASDSQADIIVNATSIESSGQNEIPIDDRVFAHQPLVMDILVKSSPTPFLARAAANDCQVIPGVRMLVLQGAAAFNLLTQQDAPIDVMAEAVARAMKD
jgi:shikimate dehydrogenase